MSSEKFDAQKILFWFSQHKFVPNFSSENKEDGGPTDEQDSMQKNTFAFEKKISKFGNNSARYDILVDGIKKKAGVKQVSLIVKKNLSSKSAPSYRSLNYYFQLLAYLFKEKLNSQEFESLAEKIRESLKDYFEKSSNHSEEEKKELQDEVLRIISTTQLFFQGGDQVQVGIRKCYLQKQIKKKKQGNTKNYMKKCLSKVKEILGSNSFPDSL